MSAASQVIGEGTRLLSSILRDRSHTIFRQVRRDWLLDNEPDLYDFISGHSRQYGNIPSVETARQNGFTVIEVAEPCLYYLNNTSDRAAYNNAVNMHSQIGQALQNRDMATVSRLHQEAVRTVSSQRFDQDTMSIHQVGEQVLDQLIINQTTYSNNGVMTGYRPIDDDLMGLRSGDLMVIAARMKQGKAQPLSSKVLLENGKFVCMGDVRIGDRLASVDGSESVVDGIFPQGNSDIYKITFSDGRSARATIDHLWEVDSHHWGSAKVVDTRQLISLMSKKRYQKNLYINTLSGDFGNDSDLPIDPWLLGFLIGDGCFRGSQVKLSNSEADNLRKVAEKSGCVLVHDSGCDYRLNKSANLIKELKNLGLWGLLGVDKYIPDIYLQASKHQRLELIRGLIDSDGTIDDAATVSVQFTNERLAMDTQSLVRSLGCICLMQSRVTSSGKTAYRMNLRHENTIQFVSSEKHIRRYNNKSKGRYKKPRNRVVSIELDGNEQAQCIHVTHPRHLYVTDDYVVTHNTYFLLNMTINAWLSGKSVLFVSMEMSPREILDRITAIMVGLNPRLMRSNELNSYCMGNITDTIRGFQNLPPFHFVAGNFRKSPADIRRSAELLSPDLISIDGTYLLKPEKANSRYAKHELMGDVIAEIKSIGEDLHVPSINTLQINRMGAGTARSGRRVMQDALAPENIAGTDDFARVATIGLGIGNIAGRADAKRLKTLFTRNGEGDADMMVNFKFSPPDFSYIGEYVEEPVNGSVNNLDQATRDALV